MTERPIRRRRETCRLSSLRMVSSRFLLINYEVIPSLETGEGGRKRDELSHLYELRDTGIYQNRALCAEVPATRSTCIIGRCISSSLFGGL